MERDRTRRETLDDDTLSLFCSQLSLMLQAGIGVEEGAALLAGDADELGQRTLLAGLRAGLDRGEPLSQALEATGGFPDYLLRMVEIGQASGRLDQVLAALGRYYARQADTRPGPAAGGGLPRGDGGAHRRDFPGAGGPGASCVPTGFVQLGWSSPR